MKTFITRYLGVVMFGLLIAPQVHAQLAVESERIESVIPQIDGDLSEWTGWGDNESNVSFTLLGGPEIIDGSDSWESEDDYSASVAFVHDNRSLYFAATIRDDTIVHTKKGLASEDHIELRLALVKGLKGNMTSLGLGIFVDPVSQTVDVRKLDSKKSFATKAVPEVEAAMRGTANNYSFELRIPWSSLPLSEAKQAGMRVGIFAVDCDDPAGRVEDTVIGTAPLLARKNHQLLPLFGLSDVTRPLGDFWKEMKLSPRLTARYFAAFDLVAGAGWEQVIVADKYLMAFGAEIDTPGHYSYIELPVKSAEHVKGFEFFDATGDSKKDIILEFEVDNGTESRRWTSIYSLDENHKFQRVFSAATLINSMMMRVENDLRFVKGPGKSLSVRMTAKKTQGIEEALGESAPEFHGTPMVVSWDKPAHATYTFDQGRYVRK